jgi:hypothetical protein
MLKNNSTHTSLGSKYQYVIQFEKKKFNRILINEFSTHRQHVDLQ